MNIYTKVVAALKAQNRTQQDLATALGVSYMQLYRYLHGNITIDNLARIADALKTTPADLLREERETTPETSERARIVCPHCGKILTIRAEETKMLHE